MAKKYSGKDVHNWKACDYSGKPLTYPADYPTKEKRNKPANDFDGYATANAYAMVNGGVAARV